MPLSGSRSGGSQCLCRVDQAHPHNIAPYYDHLPNSVVDDTDLVLKAVVFRENLATVLVNSQHSPWICFRYKTSDRRNNKSIFHQAQHLKRKLHVIEHFSCVIVIKLFLRVDKTLDQKFVKSPLQKSAALHKDPEQTTSMASS